MSGAYCQTTLRSVIAGGFVAASAVGGSMLWSQSALAGESYPPGGVSLVADPVDCVDNIVSGYVEGAEPGTTVTFEIVIELGDGTEETLTLLIDADANGVASFSTEFVEGAEEATVTSQGQEVGSLQSFEVELEVDLETCDDDDDDNVDDDDGDVGGDGGSTGGGSTGSGSLAAAGSDPQPWLQIGSMLAALGAILVIAATRRRRQRTSAVS